MRAVDGLERRDAHGTAGAVHELDLRREHSIDPVPHDRMRLPPAHLHEYPRPGRRLGDTLREPARDRWVTVFVHVFHGAPPSSSRSFVELADLFQHLPGPRSLLSVDLRDREAYVDEDEIPGPASG